MQSSFAEEGADQEPTATRSHLTAVRGTRRVTIADVLRLPVALDGHPEIIVGEELVDRPVRWVRVVELAYAEGPVASGDLVLASGPGLPGSAEEISQYVDELADQEIAGIVVGLARRFASVPPAMVRACKRRRLPLVVLTRDSDLARIADAARSAIDGGHVQLLEMTVAAHERFTELALADAPVEEIVTAVSALSGAQVVFANLLQQALALDARGGSTEALLARWELEQFRPGVIFGVQTDPNGCMITAPVTVRGRQRGRLTLFTQEEPSPWQLMVAERGAAALAIRLGHESDDTLHANARRTVLSDIIRGRFTSAEAMHARSSALGHPTRGREMLPVAVIWEDDNIGGVLRQALADTRLDGIVGDIGDRRWGVLLLRTTEVEGHLAGYIARVKALCAQRGLGHPPLSRGPVVTDITDIPRAFAEALEVATVAELGAFPASRNACYSIGDVQLRGLLCMMRDDPRVQSFAARTLGPLLVRDSRDGSDFIHTLAVYLRLRGNKSLAAQELGVSRPTLYERLARIQRLLQVDLADPETSASLLAAIMVAEAVPTGTSQTHSNTEQLFASFKTKEHRTGAR